MTNTKRIIIYILFIHIFQITHSQEFITIWNDEMPNSKGIAVEDSIANERIYKVNKPGVDVFLSSRAENKKVAVLIIPGGGYARLSYNISGWQLAKWFNTMGINAFVLRHRLPQSPDVEVSYKVPLTDAQRAIRYIRANADKYEIDVNKVGVIGCSAGGHLSASLSTIKEDWGLGNDSLDNHSPIPNYSILISPVISMKEYTHKGSRNNLLGENASEELKTLFSCNEQVNENTPPALMIHASNDRSVSPMNSILYYTALKEKDIKNCSLHIFPEGGHNIALRNNPGSTQSWTTLTEMWLREIGILE